METRVLKYFLAVAREENITKAAELLHMKPEALLASIEQKRCPFGFCWQLGDRVAYKIPTLTFYQWLMGRAA